MPAGATEETMERLYDTRQAAELLSVNEREVRRLISNGHLQAKVQPLRGTGARPQKFILASEIQRYLNDLQDAPCASTVPDPRKRARASRRGALAGVIEFVR